MAILETVHIRGTSYRREEARDYVRALRATDRSGTEIPLLLRREPDNAADPDAIMVLAQLNGADCHIGYLPWETAAQIALDWPAGMPLAACINRISTKMGYDAIFIEVLRPAKRSPWWKANMPADT